ncbi:MAG: hypothetical protein J6W29_09340 [Neisseriaceae bacterium]|nr:hypothetical protein [Neisseriaceae bacterium]
MNFKKISTAVFFVGLVCLGLTACDKNTVSNEMKNIITKQSQNTSYKTGKIVDNEYINESLGLKFVLPKEYRFFTDDEMAAAMNIGIDELVDKSKADKLKKEAITGLGMEMAAVITTTYDNNLNLIVRDFPFDIDEETFAKKAKEQVKSMIANGNIIYYQDSKQNLGEIEFYVLSQDLVVDGEKTHQKQFIKLLNKKAVTITFTYTTEDELNKMINAFQKI